MMQRRITIAAWMLALSMPAVARAESVAFDGGGVVCHAHGECPCGLFCAYGRCSVTAPPDEATSCASDLQCNTPCTGTVCREGHCARPDASVGESDLGAGAPQDRALPSPDLGRPSDRGTVIADEWSIVPPDAPRTPPPDVFTEPPVDAPRTPTDPRPVTDAAVTGDADVDASTDTPPGRVVVSCTVAPHRGDGDGARLLAALGVCVAAAASRRRARR